MAKILFILTSHERFVDGRRTGLWLEEFAVPYLAFSQAGHDVVVSSVAGGDVPIDPNSEPSASQTAEWGAALAMLDNTPAFDAIDDGAFKVAFLPGGHGTVFDMPHNRRLHDLLFRFDERERIIACVCHAPAAMTGMYRADGTPFVHGRRIAAFTDAEERAGKTENKVPFLLETRLRELGAHHVWVQDFMPNAIVDDLLVTGQNPQSSAAVAALVLELLGEVTA